MQQPKADNFENAWKEAFDKASLAPPEIIWKNIEGTLPQVDTFGTKSAGNYISKGSKLLIGAGLIFMASIAYFYFKSTNNNQQKLTNYANEKNTSRIIEPAAVEPKNEIKNLVASPTITAKKNVISFSNSIKKSLAIKQNYILQNPKIEENELQTISKIEVKLFEIIPKSIKQSSIYLEIPQLIPITDSQQITPYYDPNVLQNLKKNKNQFWKNFKIRGGIRVSN